MSPVEQVADATWRTGWLARAADGTLLYDLGDGELFAVTSETIEGLLRDGDGRLGLMRYSP